ncbi:LysR family transcriptional regulator [Celerinatantimonas sp. MCCC 1A17872]|uniref:LysR family transcriptional regulator n=1 Tax=Celerinatantimonas sp. MCCC 1A17872 TaxID=3177514 RepID=UPI0038BE856F
MDKLKCLQAFVMTVETGTFAAAAEKLSLSPQRVARAVAQLEQQLTLPLLRRTTRVQTLTEFGQRYYAQAREILNHIEDADAIALQMRNRPEGLLRVSAPVSFGNTILMDFICEFLNRYPAIEIDLNLSDHLGKLEDNDSDVAFRIGNKLDPERVAKPLKPYQLVTCAAPKYFTQHNIPTHPEQLIEHQCLLYRWSLPNQQDTWTFNQDGQRFEQSIFARLRVNDSHALLRAALAGEGIIMAPRVLVQEFLISGKLLTVLDEFTPPPRQMHLIYPAELKRRAKVQVFIDAALRKFTDPVAI